jgi:putative FmdB family regulatory protein
VTSEPEYAYQCRKCGKKFAVTMPISEHDRRKGRCPKCDSGRVVQQIGTFFAQTIRKR